MVVQFWHPLVLVALLALVVWGLRVSPRGTSLGLAVTLLVVSGFLLYTLVLEESGLELDRNAQLDTVAMIGIPAVLGIGLGVFALRRTPGRGV